MKGSKMVREAFEGGQLKFLEQGDIVKIHETSLRILEEVGIKISLPEALEIYKKGGAVVRPDSQTVRLPAKMRQRGY